MNAGPAPSVVLLSGPGTLAGLGATLNRAKVRLVRVAALEPRPVDPATWMGRFARTPTPDTVVVTSRTAVEAGVRPWRRALGPFPRSLEFWAVGPETAGALRRAGARRVHRPRTVGATAIARALARTRSRRVVYFRSDVAGPDLARALRRQGHRVRDVIVYRLEAPGPLPGPARRALGRAALLIVTSPSGLSYLRARLDQPAFARLSRTAHLVVLGDRSRKAARDHGFRHVSVAPATGGQRFSRYLLRELRYAGA
jgi:uroporphyrinogen-III synthase